MKKLLTLNWTVGWKPTQSCKYETVHCEGDYALLDAALFPPKPNMPVFSAEKVTILHHNETHNSDQIDLDPREQQKQQNLRVTAAVQK